MTDDTQEYIKKMREAGKSEDEITQKLLAVGWDKDKISEILKESKNQKNSDKSEKAENSILHCHNCGIQLKVDEKFCTSCGIKVSGHVVNGRISSTQSSGIRTVSKYHKKMGLIFIIGPFAILVFILLVWSIVVFVVSQSGTDTESGAIKFIQWVLGFIGLFSVMGIFILVPLGIYFLNKKTITSESNFDGRSGQGGASVVPSEIQGWNWGAAGLTWIWGLSNNVWISLLTFIPLINIFWWIVLGIKGNEWAWQAKEWDSVEQFKESQRKWGIWGIAIIGLGVGLFIFSILINIVFIWTE